VTKLREDETGGGMWHAWRKKRKFIQGLDGGNPEGKSSLGRPGRWWEDDVLMDLKCDMHCIHLAEDRCKWWAVVNTAVYRRIP